MKASNFGPVVRSRFVMWFLLTLAILTLLPGSLIRSAPADMKRSNLAFPGNLGRVCKLPLAIVLAAVALLCLSALWLGGPRQAQAAPPLHPSHPGFDLTFIVVADPQFRGPSNACEAQEYVWGNRLVIAMNAIDQYSWPSASQWGRMYGVYGWHQLQGGGQPIATPDFVVVAGDMTMGAQQDQLERFRYFLECDSAGLDCPMIEYPVYAGLGNHDLPDNSSDRQRMWDYISSRYAGVGPGAVDCFFFDDDSYAYSWTPDGDEMYLLQMHRFAGDGEYTPSSNLPVLQEHLEQLPGELFLLFQHYGWDAGTAWWTDADRAQLAGVIDGHNVKGIFAGHTHDYDYDETATVSWTNVYTAVAGASVIHLPAMIDWEDDLNPGSCGWTIEMGWFAVVRVTDTYMDIAWVQVTSSTPVNFYVWRSVPLNEAPSVDAGADATIDEGSAFTRSGVFTDTDADEWTATVDYGDGSGTQVLALYPSQTFDLDHTYADDGIFTAVVTVTDHHGAVGTDDVRVTVNNLPPTVTSFSKSGSEDADISFTAAEFADNFDDVPADPLVSIGIASLPNHGTLRLGGSPVTVGQGIPSASVDDLVFTPDADWNGVTSFGWNGHDGQVYAAAPAAVNITVSPVNDAPVLAPFSPAMTSIGEDNTANPGMTVAGIVGASIDDVDSGALEGIAIYALNSGNGTWQYWTGSSWQAVGAVSTDSALLLRSGGIVRFVPNSENGTSASFSYYGWDQTSGSPGVKVNVTTRGGTTAFSTASDTASIVVSSVNDAPVLTTFGPAMTSISEDNTANPGMTVADIVGASIGDVDSGALEGIAIYALNSGNGTWLYRTGSIWYAVVPVSTNSALLLRSGDSVRFVPNSENATVATFSYYAWDQTSGFAGARVNVTTRGGTTAFSTASDTAYIIVTPVNDAPVLAPFSPAMPPIGEDDIANPGMTVADIVGASIGDVDGGAVEGIAIYALDSGNSTWQYKTSSSWQTVGAVSTNSALLLRSSDSVRFVPDGENGTSASFSYYAWDQTSGSAGAKVNAATRGGTTAFSSASDTASITVNPVNDAPELDNSGDLRLDTINEDDTSNAGTVVSAIVASADGDRITDVDAGAVEGIAVVGADSTHGTWQYSTDGGSNWHDLGSSSPGAARLLASSAVIRFVPDADYNGTVDPGITFRAWDQSSGTNGGIADTASNGGTTPFSTATETASIVVRIAADLAVGKLAEPTTVVPGRDAITYTIVVHNPGPSTIVGATLTDALPAALVNPTWTCVASGAACPSPAGSGALDETLVLPEGSVLTYTITGMVDSSATSLTNTVYVDNPAYEIDVGDNSAAIVSTLQRQADVSIAKSQAWAGSSITYTVVVRNFGPSDAPGAAVSDPAPVELGGVLWTCVTAGGATCGGSGSGDIDEVVDLPAGSVITYTLTGVILQAPVVNEATVTPPVAVNDLISGNNRATVQYLRVYLPLLMHNHVWAPNLVVVALWPRPPR